MKAARYYGAGDIRIEDVPLPQPAADEALVKVLRSGLCGTDVTEWTSGPIMIPLHTQHPHSGHHGPMTPGHEIFGEVVTAPADSGLQPGDLVASGAQIACGECKTCLAGRPNVCAKLHTLGLQRDGGHAEYVAAPVKYLVKAPAGIDIDAAGLTQPLAVGLHAVRRSGAVAGDHVLVTGMGAIGTFVLAALRHLVPDVHIVVADVDPVKLERAVRLGANETVNFAAGDEPAAFTADVVIECAGAPGLLAKTFGWTRTGGRVLAVGMSAKPQEIDPHDFVLREITIEATNALITDEDIPVALEILATTDLGREMLDSVRGLGELTEALDAMAAGKVQGKILIDPSR